ncbi:MAG: hypothetical protein HQ486_06385 [Acidimicrobiaceae bacterium]|nr:hypothetical protein [Acidimicrobiaceae bacterium]
MRDRRLHDSLLSYGLSTRGVRSRIAQIHQPTVWCARDTVLLASAMAKEAGIELVPTPNIYGVGKPQNFGNIGNAKIDDLFKKANNVLDPVKRCALANEADKNVANFGAFGFTSLDWTKVGFTKTK